jgi:hypothetical protein
MSEFTNDRLSGLAFRLSSMLQRLKQSVLERSKHGKPRRMVLLEALQLGNRRQLFLVACDEHRFLVGAGSDRIGTLVAFPETTPETVPGAPSGNTKSRAGMEQANPVRGRETGRERAWMRASGFERTTDRGLQLVQRDHATANGAAARKGLEAGRTQ